MAFDWEKFGQTIVDATKAHIDKSFAPLVKRIEALESINVHALVAEAVQAIPTPQDGKSVTMDDVRPMLADMVKESGDELEQALYVMVDKAVSQLPPAKDGKDADPVDMEAVRTMIVEECKDVRAALEQTIGPEMQEALAVQVAEAVKNIPVPKDGESGKDADPVDVDALKLAITEDVKASLPDIASLVDDAVKALPPAKDGKDADPVDVDALKSAITEDVKASLPDVSALVAKAVSEITIEVPELPDIGAIVDTLNQRLDDVTRTTFEEFRRDIMAIPVPRDGQDGKSVTVDDVRPIIDDAVSKAMSEIPVPKDGRDGADVMDAFQNKDGHLILTFSNGRTKDVGRVVGDDGVDCDIDGVWRILNEKLAALPPPKDGRDGLGFDDLSVEYDNERTFKFVFARDDQRKEFEFRMPVILDRGVFVDGKSYERGDSVSWSGSSWIAQVDGATKKPGEGNNEWRLATKRGKSGRDGVVNTPRPNVPVQLGV